MRRLVACLVVLAGGVLAAQSQAPIFRTGVDVVRLDVSVLDKNRRPVRGLTAADFSVLEDGKPQRVVGVSEVVADEHPEPPPVWSRSVQPDVESNNYEERRLFVLLIDDALCCSEFPILQPNPRANPRDPRVSNTARFDPWAADAVKSIGRGIISRLAPGDAASVIYARNTRASQRFTANTQQLLDAVDAFVPTGAETCMGYRESIRRLWDVTEYLMAVPQRRKSILYVSPGVPVPMLPSDAKLNCPLFDPANDVKQILWRAQQANVNIYSIDPNGLVPGAWLGSRKGLRLEFLQTMAENSGGHAFINSNEFEPGIAKIFEENASYYVLGYQASNLAADGKFRRLTVRLNRPGDDTLRVRSGFYRPKPDPDAGSAATATASTVPASLANLLPQLDMTLQVNTTPFAMPGRTDSAVAVAVAVRERVPSNVPSLAQTLSLRVFAYTTDGDPKYSSDLRIPLTLVVDGDDTARAELFSKLDLPPGRYRLRVVVHDAGRGATGSIEQDVVVPDFQRDAILLSGVVLTAGRAPVSGGADRLSAILPVTPTARREFLTTDAVGGLVRVYQGGQGNVAAAAITIRVLDRKGAEILRTVETLESSRFDANRTAEVRFDVPLSKLAAGPHLLTLEAALGSKRSLPRDVVFEVR